MFFKIDDFVEWQFQLFSNWSQVHLEKNCYWWGGICIHALGILCLMICGFFVTELPHVEAWKIALYSLFAFFCLIVSGVLLLWLPEWQRASRLGKPVMFARKDYIRLRRLIFLGLFFEEIVSMSIYPIEQHLEIIDFLRTSYWFFLACMYYFMTCIPLPPQKKKQEIKGSAFNPATSA